EAAARDGVTLGIEASDRTPSQSQMAALARGNPAAIASFSSHNLGLAIDFTLSVGRQQFQETTTTPMKNVIDMRTSPVHKWLFLYASQFGFFPYINEPWHWEFNPAGFRATFWANRPGGAP